MIKWNIYNTVRILKISGNDPKLFIVVKQNTKLPPLRLSSKQYEAKLNGFHYISKVAILFSFQNRICILCIYLQYHLYWDNHFIHEAEEASFIMENKAPCEMIYKFRTILLKSWPYEICDIE